MPTHEEMIRAIERLLGRIKKIIERSRARHPKGDLRVALPGLPGNALHTYLLYVTMSDSTIGRLDWWQQSYGSPTRPHSRDMAAIHELEIMTKHCMFVFFLSRIEWNFRKLVTYLDPNACNGGHDSFKNLYGWLLKRLGLKDFVPLYDVCRHVRNAVHTNGHYVPRNGKDDRIELNGTEFLFHNMKAIDFMTHETLFSLYHGLVDSLDAILNANLVQSAKYIEDKIHP